jgi:hypothetical protein
MKPRFPFPSLKFPALSVMALTLLACGIAQAQIGIFANFTAATQDRVSSTNTNQYWIYGPTFGIYGQFPLPLISIGADLRGEYLTGSQLHHWDGVLGPRLEIKPPGISLHPYAEFLVGIGGYQDNFYSSTTTTHVDYDIVAGIDRKLIPLIDWRVIEFTYNSYFNKPSSAGSASKQLSTGLVLRLP